MNDSENTLIAHLDALRRTLLRCVTVTALLYPVGYLASPYVINALVQWCFPESAGKLHYFAPMEVFWVQLKLALILALAGCDLLTISPDLLAQLQQQDAPVIQALSHEAAKQQDLEREHYDEASFRLALNQDAMATEKLAEGIRAFVADAQKLEQLIRSV